MLNQHKLGQYFTTNIDLKKKVYDFILNKPTTILEPSIGQGDLIEYILIRHPNIIFDMYEIDETIELLDIINKDLVIYGDFLQQEILGLYKTIIGNPPYVRTKKGNLYIDFITKCYNLLDNNGELIFIIPSDFLKLTSSCKILNEMMNNGTFTHIYHPHNEQLFQNANIDIIIFRYCKNKELEKKVLYNDNELFILNKNGLITFTDKLDNKTYIFNDYFNIYVGIVSGLDEVYKNENYGNIDVLISENTTNKFIYINKYPSNNININNYLLQNKQKLLNRKIKKFNENNWYEWGAPRNIKLIEDNLGKDCIYIYNLTRKDKVAFIGKVQYFNGNFLLLLPKQNINLQKIIDYLNSMDFKKNFIFSGRFKIGQKQLCDSYINDEYL